MHTIFHTIKKILKENLFIIESGLFFVLIYLIFSEFILISVVQTGSMEPTLSVGNTVFYNHCAYFNHAPERGDIVMFWSKEFNEFFAKRIIALPGEEIRFIDGKVVVDNHVVNESDYLLSGLKTFEPNHVTFKVPENCYFMLGDNRENSYDSRFWNDSFISIDDIYGKYLFQIKYSVQFDILHDYPSNKVPLNIIIPSEKPENTYLDYVIKDMKMKDFSSIAK